MSGYVIHGFGDQAEPPRATLTEFLAGLNDQPWTEHALCAQTDPEAFYPEKGGSTRIPKRVCLSCDVRSDCLAYALEHGERYGIWGGLSERERRRLMADPDAPPRPCARVGCAETIPATAHGQKRYHDLNCRRIAREDLVIAGIDHQPILDGYLAGDAIGRIASRHKVTTYVVTRILDQHGVDHSRAISRARRKARHRVQEAS